MMFHYPDEYGGRIILLLLRRPVADVDLLARASTDNHLEAARP
ncbi:hypothetical protein [Janthinobacterium sp. HLX7-2]